MVARRHSGRAWLVTALSGCALAIGAGTARADVRDVLVPDGVLPAPTLEPVEPTLEPVEPTLEPLEASPEPLEPLEPVNSGAAVPLALGKPEETAVDPGEPAPLRADTLAAELSAGAEYQSGAPRATQPPAAPESSGPAAWSAPEPDPAAAVTPTDQPAPPAPLGPAPLAPLAPIGLPTLAPTTGDPVQPPAARSLDRRRRQHRL
jgi:hypothetical protein